MNKIAMLLLLPGLCFAENTIDLTLNQVSLTNWSRSGQEALSWNLQLHGDNVLDNEIVSLDIKYKAEFGQSKIGEEGFRKTNDRFRGDAQLNNATSFFIDPFVAATVKTQIAPGYDYNPKRKVSEFGNPFDLSYSAGYGFSHGVLQSRVGFSIHQIYKDDNWDTKKGGESVTTINWKASESLTVTGRGEVFFHGPDLTRRYQTETGVRYQVGIISILLSVETLHEDDSDVEVRQTLGLGIGWKL